MPRKSRKTVPDPDELLAPGQTRRLSAPATRLPGANPVVVTVPKRLPPDTSRTWIEAEIAMGLEWELVGRFLVDLETGSAALKEVRIRPHVGAWTDEIGEISTAWMRAAPLAALRATTQAVLAAWSETDRPPPFRASAPNTTPRAGRPIEWSHERLAKLADRYVRLWDSDERSSAYSLLAAEFGIGAKRVRDLIHSARQPDVGVLTPTRQGRGGGQLTPYGRSLNEQGASDGHHEA